MASTTETNPLDETFEPIPVDNMDEEFDKTKGNPLEEDWYKLKITDIEIKKTKPTSKFPNQPLVRFKCEVEEDSNEENNGRQVFSDNFTLVPGEFFFKFFLNFALAMTPSRKFKKGELSPDYIKSFTDCSFKAHIVKDYEMEDDYKTFKIDEKGEKILNGYNSMDEVKNLRD